MRGPQQGGSRAVSSSLFGRCDRVELAYGELMKEADRSTYNRNWNNYAVLYQIDSLVEVNQAI